MHFDEYSWHRCQLSHWHANFKLLYAILKQHYCLRPYTFCQLRVLHHELLLGGRQLRCKAALIPSNAGIWWNLGCYTGKIVATFICGFCVSFFVQILGELEARAVVANRRTQFGGPSRRRGRPLPIRGRRRCLPSLRPHANILLVDSANT